MTREIKFRFWSKILKGYRVPMDTVLAGAFKDKDMVVQQFTGLKDKNGVEIYEGDVVRLENYRDGNLYIQLYEVIYDHDGFGLKFLSRDRPCQRFVNDKGYIIAFGNPKKDDRFTLRKEEVIGNIYENPELLTENKSSENEK